MIPELIISGEEANGEFLMLVPGKMLFCSFCVMLMKQVRKIASYSAAIFLIPICISFDTAEKRRYATYLILNRRFSFEF